MSLLMDHRHRRRVLHEPLLARLPLLPELVDEGARRAEVERLLVGEHVRLEHAEHLLVDVR